MSETVCWVFSIYNEAENSYLWKNLDLLMKHKQTLIVVDGGSEDATVKLLHERGITPLVVPKTTRGQRYDLGIQHSTARDLIFVHPRTLLAETSLSQAAGLPLTHDWGAFTHSFDAQHFLLQFTSWWSNCIRGDLRGIYYLDHVLWARRSILSQASGFPHAAIFEDTLFCKKLLAFGKPIRLKDTTVTSAIRFKKNGLTKQILKNQLAKFKYYFGLNSDQINHHYESGLDLNGQRPPQGQQAAASDPPSDRT